jgi:hypothetical protein
MDCWHGHCLSHTINNQLFYQMKKPINYFQKWIAVLAIGFVGFACTEKEDADMNEPQSQATLTAEAFSSTSVSSSSSRIIVNGFATREFWVGSKDVEMKYAAKADLLAGISLGSITLRTNVNAGLQTAATKNQTFAIISNGEVKSTIIGQGRTPEGNYQELSFRLFKNTEVESTDPVYEKSLLIMGEVQGKSSNIWLNTEKMIRAKAESSQGVEVDGQTEMVLIFDMDKLFANVDFATAVDTNADGRIDIGPGAADTNAVILAQIESNLESAVILKKK